MSDYHPVGHGVRIIFLVEGRAGEYEPSFWTVGAWTTRESADKEAVRLSGLAHMYWTERYDLGEAPDTKIPDPEWEPLFEAWEAKSKALLEKYRVLGDPQLDRHEHASYFVTETKLHTDE